ncbi:MAG: LacI family transcriptional regulator [Fusicatenibacter sp.]|nr:LacI family transcriptional regulator [Fusicatenibacter sp.]
MVSIKDVSIACGVSIATVSKALNNHKDVGEETKERVRETARRMGYVPNFASKVLITNRTYNIGILFTDESGSDLTNDHFAKVLNSLKCSLEEKGYDITFVNKNGNISVWDKRMTYLEHCKYRRFDGVAILCTDFHDPEIIELVESDVPVITFDHVFNDRSAVVSDVVKGISDLVHYVYDMGHRKIAYIHGEDSAETRNRVSSFYRSCESFGIEVPPEYIKEAPYHDTTQTYLRTVELLQLRERPTCIFFPDDFAYVGGYNAITLAGLRVPDDISTIGYDGIEIGKYLEPALATLVQDADRLGRELARKLIDMIEQPKTCLVEHILVEGKVYPGRSVKKLM